jgi:UDP-N-acetylmuramoyl-tripeptide--D-alanyl-D-alanine ligase
MKKINPIIQWWLTPKFPLVHLKDNTGFIKKWFFHPVKRRLARWYLKLLQKFTGIKVIAITGSAGKTTTKEMLASILKNNHATIYSKENIDPIYNIPTTILRTPLWTKYLILEMGVEYPGEMDFYLWLVKPDIGVITNIFPTHLEFLENIKGVLSEKSKLVLGLSRGNTAVLNMGDQELKSISKNIKAKVVWFKGGENPILQDSLAAEAVAKSLGVGTDKIKIGLASYQKPKHRLSLINLKNGTTILDDSYNSNPEAVLSTLKYFEKIATGKKKYAVLGDMKELGSYEEEAHRKVGREVARMGFDGIIAVGKPAKYFIYEVKIHSPKTDTHLVDNEKQAEDQLKQYLKSGNYILVKGSRSIALDKLVDALV